MVGSSVRRFSNELIAIGRVSGVCLADFLGLQEVWGFVDALLLETNFIRRENVLKHSQLELFLFTSTNLMLCMYDT